MTPKHSFQMQNPSSGSSSSDEPEFLAIGKLRRPHGIYGEILMSVWTDFPERIQPETVVYAGEQQQELHVKTVRWHRDDLLLSFVEFQNRETVGVLRNQTVFVPADHLPELEEGEIYLHQILGLTVIHQEDLAVLGEKSYYRQLTPSS